MGEPRVYTLGTRTERGKGKKDTECAIDGGEREGRDVDRARTSRLSATGFVSCARRKKGKGGKRVFFFCVSVAG